MKYKIFSIFFFLNIISVSLLSQEIKITIKTPIIRQGTEVKVKFEFLFFKNYLNNQLNKSFEKPGTSQYMTKFLPKDTGEIQIGPLEFDFDSVKYRSNITKIKVLPPIDQNPGIYVNLYYYGGKNFLLIEQIYENKDINSKYSSSFSYNVGSELFKDSLVYPDFKTNSKIKITYNENTSKKIWIKRSKKDNEPFYYSSKFFEIVNSSGHKIVLTKNFFKNLPSDYILPKLMIK